MNKGWFSFLFLFIFFLCVGKSIAQISKGGIPPSFQYENELRSKKNDFAQVPVNFSVEDLKLVDEWKVGQGAPLRISALIPVDLTTENAGKWITLPSGETIWRLPLQAKNAIALMLYYKTFYIPEGGQLFIYDVDRTHLLGAYTEITNPSGGRFATEFVAGDELVLEYVLPDTGELPVIEIEAIGYGYNHIYITQNVSLRDTGSSSSCLVNINCEEGEEWQNEKAGVCLMITTIGKYAYYCTGSLINNTAQDFLPYILSAYHCSDDGIEISSEKDLEQWIFYFNYETEDCEGRKIKNRQSMVGCARKAAIPLEGGSDGLLVLLNDDIPESYDVYYNGWDRRDIAPESGVNIHHPNGDIKKISTFTQPATDYTWADAEGNRGDDDAHWDVRFAATVNGHSVTEEGSSGSPLFNEHHLITATLTGGNSSCTRPTGLNVYGKLYYHWDQYGTDDSGKMNIWLDPIQSGGSTLVGRSKEERAKSPRNLTLDYNGQQILLSWEAPVSSGLITDYYIYRNGECIGTVQNTMYIDSQISEYIDYYGVSAVYMDQSESVIVSKPAPKIDDPSHILFPDKEDPIVYPLVFREQVQISHIELVKRIDVYNIEGKRIWSTHHPSDIISTNTWASGIYIFQLHTNRGIKVLKGIKK